MSSVKNVLFGTVLFLFAPFLVAEPFVRHFHQNMLERFESRLKEEPIELILVGSSRVGAAFDADTLSAELSRLYKKPIHVANLGRGYSRPHDKYLAFKYLFSLYRFHLKNSWLLIEATQGVPDQATWESPWAIPEELGLISTYIEPMDFSRMLTQSETSKAVSLQVGFYRYVRSALMLRKVRDVLDLQNQIWQSPDFLAASHPMAESSSQPALAETGGVLAAQSVVDLTRKTIELPQQSSGEIHFEKTVWADVARLAQDYGVHVAFFNPPMSTVDATRVRNSFSESLRQQVSKELSQRGIKLLNSAREFPDTAYPDLLHLQAGQAPIYSKAFAQMFLAEFPDAF